MSLIEPNEETKEFIALLWSQHKLFDSSKLAYERAIDDLKFCNSDASKYIKGLLFMRLEKFQDALNEFAKIAKDNGMCPLDVFELGIVCLFKRGTE